MKAKKNQQETIGFVIIIVLVMIIGTIFLGIWLRSSKNSGVYTESKEIDDFLSASLSQTTDCYKDGPSDFKHLGELIGYCNSGTEISCPNNEKTCDYLNRTYSEMLQKLKPAGVLGYYKLFIYYKPYEENESPKETEIPESSYKSIIEIVYGSLAECTVRLAGNQLLNAENGDFIVNLETCEAK